ncbi:MAG: threonine synthase [Actinomycetes bacterium]
MTATLGTNPELGAAHALRCRECSALYGLDASYACFECFGPLEVAYTDRSITREAIEAGPLSMWRYEALLPVVPGASRRPGLQPGFTQLIKADNLARALGAKSVWVKDDSGNPTHSFKDRVVAVALENARRLGFETIACASTGNLANAVAAAAARAGLKSVVFVPSDLEAGKIVTTAVYGGILVAIGGNYDDVNRLCTEVAASRNWGFVNVNLRPYYAEGSKTVGYEIAEQLGWRLPDAVVSPVASGSLLTKVDKAFHEFVELGLVQAHDTKIYGAQATGCSPVSQAFAAGQDFIKPVKPNTIAKSLAIGNPADGPYALDVVRKTNGALADVSDDEVVEGIKLLAETEGIFAETAGGVVVGVYRKLLRDGLIDPEAEVVLLNTGEGLKTLDAVAPTSGPTISISPSYDDFEAAYKEITS